MKKYLWILYLAILFLAACSKPTIKEVEFIPENPKSREKVKIYYDNSKGKLKDVDNIYVRIYYYSYGEPVMKEVLMRKENDRYAAEFIADKNFDGAMIIFADSAFAIKDNNNDKGYAVKFFDENNFKKKFAETGYASLLAWHGYSYQAIEMDRDSALKIFESEFAKNPELKKYYIFEYYRSLRRLNPEKFKNIALKDFDFFYNDKSLNENQLENLFNLSQWIKSDIIKNLNNNISENSLPNAEEFDSKIDSIIARLEKINPTNKYVLNSKFNVILNIADKRQKEKELAEFEKKYPDSENLQFYFYNSINQLIENKKYDEALKLLYDKLHILKEMSLAFVDILGPNLKNLEKLKEIIKLEEERLIKNKTEKKFDETTLKIYGERLAYSFFKYGEDLILKSKVSIALLEKKEKEAYELLYENKEKVYDDQNYFDLYLRLASKYNPTEQILNDAISSAQKIKLNESIIVNLKSLYVAVKGSEEGFDKIISDAISLSDKAFFEKLRKEEVNYKAPDFELYDLEGVKTSLKDHLGKVVVLDFWATWCPPCRKSFPTMQKAVNKYAKDTDVAFLFINAWENVENKKENAENFIKSNGYSFRVLLDDKNETITKYKVSGIPTKVFIDPKGNIRFKTAGFEGEEHALKEIDLIVNYLKNQKN